MKNFSISLSLNFMFLNIEDLHVLKLISSSIYIPCFGNNEIIATKFTAMNNQEYYCTSLLSLDFLFLSFYLFLMKKLKFSLTLFIESHYLALKNQVIQIIQDKQILYMIFKMINIFTVRQNMRESLKCFHKHDEVEKS